jgi:hypothetical protein
MFRGGTSLAMYAVFAAGFALSFEPAQAQPAPCNVFTAAVAYIALHYPGFDQAGLQPAVTDAGTLMEFTYRLRPGFAGNIPVLSVERKTCKVVNASLRRIGY